MGHEHIFSVEPIHVFVMVGNEFPVFGLPHIHFNCVDTKLQSLYEAFNGIFSLECLRATMPNFQKTSMCPFVVAHVLVFIHTPVF